MVSRNMSLTDTYMGQKILQTNLKKSSLLIYLQTNLIIYYIGITFQYSVESKAWGPIYKST